MARFVSRYAAHNLLLDVGRVQFEYGTYITDDEAQIEAIRALPEYGSVICEVKDEEVGLIDTDVHVCDAAGCGKVFKTAKALYAHTRVHK